MQFFFFFFNDTATTEIYTLSLHDALPIWGQAGLARPGARNTGRLAPCAVGWLRDRADRVHAQDGRRSGRASGGENRVAVAQGSSAGRPGQSADASRVAGTLAQLRPRTRRG